MEYSLFSLVGAFVNQSLYALGPSHPFPSKVFLETLKLTHPPLYNLIVGASVLLFWYGGWGLLDLYLPGGARTKYSATFIIGLLLLVLTGSLNEL